MNYGGTALHLAIRYGHVEVATLLINEGANVNKALSTVGLHDITVASRV